MGLYKLCIANTLKEHAFTDTVAICWAWNENHARKKFRRLYDYDALFLRLHISKVHFFKGVAILTDY